MRGLCVCLYGWVEVGVREWGRHSKEVEGVEREGVLPQVQGGLLPVRGHFGARRREKAGRLQQRGGCWVCVLAGCA